MLERTLEEWHSEMVGHSPPSPQQWECENHTTLSGTLQQWHARMTECGLHGLADGLHGLADGGSCAMQGEVLGNSYVPSGMSHSCTSPWDQLGGNHQQFVGVQSNYHHNHHVSQYTTQGFAWDQFEANQFQANPVVALPINEYPIPPPPPLINEYPIPPPPINDYPQYTSPQNLQHDTTVSSAQTTFKGLKIKNKAIPPPMSSTPQSSVAVVMQQATPMKAGAFCIDAEISGQECGNERSLKRWNDDSGAKLNGKLEDLCGPSGESRLCAPEWDQFEINRKQFGIESTFKEDLSQYTTPLNLHLIPSEVKNWAKRVAQEIETEPRGSQRWCDMTHNDEEEDEEELWSSVPRTKVATSWPQDKDSGMVPPPPPPPYGRACGKSVKKQYPQWRIKETSSPLVPAAR